MNETAVSGVDFPKPKATIFQVSEHTVLAAGWLFIFIFILFVNLKLASSRWQFKSIKTSSFG